MGYDDQTISHKNFIVRWVHRTRYNTIIKLLKKYNVRSVLDYGAGTGSFVIALSNSTWKPAVIAAYDPIDSFYKNMESKIKELNLSDIVKLYNDSGKIEPGYDAIVTMGVLEHLPLKQRQELYQNVKRLIKPGGYFIVQVPVMIGLGMVLRILGKHLLKKENDPFPLKDFILAGCFFTVNHDDGRYDESEQRTFLRHPGFDHRKLVAEIKNHFQLKEKFCGPFRMPVFLAHSFYSIFTIGE